MAVVDQFRASLAGFVMLLKVPLGDPKRVTVERQDEWQLQNLLMADDMLCELPLIHE